MIEKVKQWGIDKGITGPNGTGTIERQFAKFIEELHEFFSAETEEEKIDALGDLQVVAIQACSLIYGVDYEIDRGPLLWESVERSASCAVQNLLNSPEGSFGWVRGMAVLAGFNPDVCLQHAYDIISKRTGSMVNGQFVRDKETPMEDDDLDEPLGQACQLGDTECESCS